MCVHGYRELFETKMAADKECADRATAAHLQLAVAHMANVEMEVYTIYIHIYIHTYM
jgi:hypothetical protein